MTKIQDTMKKRLLFSPFFCQITHKKLKNATNIVYTKNKLLVSRVLKPCITLKMQ